MSIKNRVQKLEQRIRPDVLSVVFERDGRYYDRNGQPVCLPDYPMIVGATEMTAEEWEQTYCDD